MFSFLKRKDVPSEKSTTRKTPAAETQVTLLSEPVPDSVLMHDVLSTQSPPLGPQKEAWNWAIQRLNYYKARKCSDELLLRFQLNVLKLFSEYQRHVDEYVEAVGHNVPILVTCYQLLQQQQNQKAKEYADPYLQYLDRHPELFNDGHLEISDEEEKRLYYAVYGKQPDARIRDDGIVTFLLLYKELQKGILMRYASDLEERSQFDEKWLERAVKLNPCSASLWIELAKNRQNKKNADYDTAIKHALEYATMDGQLSECYSSLAMNKMDVDPKLSAALCVVAESMGGGFNAARFILSKRNISFPNNDEAIRTVRNAGIQIGYSQLVTKNRR